MSTPQTRFDLAAEPSAAQEECQMPKQAARPAGVRIALEFDGVIQGYFIECSGLGSEHEVKEFRDLSEPAAAHKIPGIKKFGNITLKRGISSDKALWDWREKVTEETLGDARKDGAIVLYDRRRREVARWEFRRAWPAKIALLPSTADGNELAFEELTIVVESLTRVR
jgi:phage tail-like protein